MQDANNLKPEDSPELEEIIEIAEEEEYNDESVLPDFEFIPPPPHLPNPLKTEDQSH